MSLPSPEQYQQALQLPLSRIFKDPQLQQGSIELSALGLPRIYSGNFALTYEVKAPSGKFAVRCFHRSSNGLALRYAAISTKLKQVQSKYFVPFEYMPTGINVDGSSYPLVKMGWASGETLSQFLSNNFKNSNNLGSLKASLQALSDFMIANQIAHGDIQLGNLMISSNGNSIQLIDYDGMYVPEIKNMGASEIGHRNFQHPKRSSKDFNEKIDFFSLIALDISLSALQKDPSLWDKTQSDEEGVIFRANDFSDPTRSKSFSLVSKVSGMDQQVRNFASVCLGDFYQIPSPRDFISGKSIPAIPITFVDSGQTTKISGQSTSKYIPNYPVINASNYSLCVKNVGNRIELIGKVIEVQTGFTNGHGARKNKPYIFLNFGLKSSGQFVRVKIWSEGIDKLSGTPSNVPSSSWVGKWVSVTGVVEPVFSSKRFGYSDVSLTIDGAGQVKLISDSDATYRLGSSSSSTVNTSTVSNNQKIIDAMAKPASQKPPTKTSYSSSGQTKQSSNYTSTYKNTKPKNEIPWWVWAIGLFFLYVLFR